MTAWGGDTAAVKLLRIAMAATAERATWVDFAACAETDPNLYFPERGEPAAPAKRVCATCPVPPYPDDAAYLDELHTLRIRLRQVIDACARLYEEAYRQAVMVRRALRAARNETARALALQMLNDAIAAMDIAYDTAMACQQAGRMLLVAEADFRWVYEEPETLVAAGHVLPYRGRWITGQAPALGTMA